MLLSLEETPKTYFLETNGVTSTSLMSHKDGSQMLLLKLKSIQVCCVPLMYPHNSLYITLDIIAGSVAAAVVLGFVWIQLMKMFTKEFI